jgi:hypothetical protein
VPQFSKIPSTSVSIRNASAPSSRANSPLAWSFSMTAYMPIVVPSSRCTTGMPPPPAQITMTSWSSNSLITSISRIRFGSGDGTARRKMHRPCRYSSLELRVGQLRLFCYRRGRQIWLVTEMRDHRGRLQSGSTVYQGDDDTAFKAAIEIAQSVAISSGELCIFDKTAY